MNDKRFEIPNFIRRYVLLTRWHNPPRVTWAGVLNTVTGTLFDRVLVHTLNLNGRVLYRRWMRLSDISDM